ncbi:MAG TPA: PIN domain-containing protein [Gaiella sp.]
MGAVLLDTTVLIDALRGRPGTTERLARIRRDGDLPFTCAINVEEVHRGLRPAEAEAAGALFLGLRLAPLRLEEGERAGTWRRDFAERGVTLAQADCLVAAAAVGVSARLATGNVRHFPMPGLVVEEWPSGT